MINDPFAVFARWLTWLDSHDGRLHRRQRGGLETDSDVIGTIPNPPGVALLIVGDLRALVEAGKLLHKLEDLLVTMTIEGQCGHCGGWHCGMCPRVKIVDYQDDGTIRRVEYHNDANDWRQWINGQPPPSTPVGDADSKGRVPLLNGMPFTSHSGLSLDFKLQCEALMPEDWAALAAIVARRIPFGKVVGIPRGGLALAEALGQHINRKSQNVLIVDDVLTTGKSMEEERAKHVNTMFCVKGFVLFARCRRRDVPAWITPFLCLDDAFVVPVLDAKP